MLTWAAIFLVIALIAGFLGFWKVEGVAMQIAKTLFFIFIILFIISLIFGLLAIRTPVIDYPPLQ